MYYLFSKTNRLETIYMCENGNSIDRPLFKTGVYPMGTLLSKAVKLLTPWSNTNYCWNEQMDMIKKGIMERCKEKSSFSSVTENDNFVRAAFEIMIKKPDYIDCKKGYNEFVRLLGVFMNFMSLCQDDSYYCYADYLNLISKQSGYDMPSFFLYTPTNNNSQSILSKEEIKDLIITGASKQTVFEPVISIKQKKLFEMSNQQQTPNSFGTLQLPIYIYEIHDIVDFIVVSLNCIFRQKFVLKKCKYCGELFVTHDRKRLYCHNQSQDEKSCYEHKKLEDQLFKERTVESTRVAKNIRSMILQKFDDDCTHEIYIKFKDLCKIYRGKMRKELVTEEEYVSIMKQYWEDVKAASWSEKRANKETNKNGR